MPTDNYDASLVMQRKRNSTIKAFKNNLSNSQNTGNYNIVRKEQTTDQSAEIIAQRTGQGCVCDTSTSGYTRRIVGGSYV
jgi:spore coat protein CotF